MQDSRGSPTILNQSDMISTHKPQINSKRRPCNSDNQCIHFISPLSIINTKNYCRNILLVSAWLRILQPIIVKYEKVDSFQPGGWLIYHNNSYHKILDWTQDSRSYEIAEDSETKHRIILCVVLHKHTKKELDEFTITRLRVRIHNFFLIVRWMHVHGSMGSGY